MLALNHLQRLNAKEIALQSGRRQKELNSGIRGNSARPRAMKLSRMCEYGTVDHVGAHGVDTQR